MTGHRNDAAFLALYKHLQKSGDTIVCRERTFTLWSLARHYNVARPDAPIAEVGVYKGGTAQTLCHAAPNAAVHLFDTFTGLPEETPGVDIHKAGQFADTDLAKVKRRLSPYTNALFHVGIFPDDTAGDVEGERFSLVHLDVDQYASNLACLRWFWPRMIDGGAIVVDDYEWEHCPGIRKSIEEFRAEIGGGFHELRTAEYQCMIMKTAQG